jgi:heme oxygenase
MTLADQLRAAIRSHHDAIEETPLAVAMIRGTVTRDAYADWLGQMRHLHAGLEQTLADCAAVAAVYSPVEMTRSGMLERDMAVFGATEAPPWEPVARLTERFAEWRVAAPWKLIGVLYVLEGSRMGSMALLRPLAGAFGISPRPGVGLDYHLDGIATRPQKWQQFRAVLSTLPLTESQRADVTAAAVETMRALCELYTSKQFALESAGATVYTA